MVKFDISKRIGYPLDNGQFHEFEAHEGGKVVSHKRWPHLPQKICLVPRRLNRPQGHIAAERIK